MAIVDDLLGIFASSIFAKSTALRSIDLTPNQRRRVRKSITDDIKACGGILYPEVKQVEVSKAAYEAAKLLKIDLGACGWNKQSSFDKGRKVFHWEHVDPVSCIQEACLKADSPNQIAAILKERIRIAWILKSEDRELTRLGFRSRRPDPRAAYDAAKIMLFEVEQKPKRTST